MTGDGSPEVEEVPDHPRHKVRFREEVDVVEPAGRNQRVVRGSEPEGEQMSGTSSSSASSSSPSSRSADTPEREHDTRRS